MEVDQKVDMEFATNTYVHSYEHIQNLHLRLNGYYTMFTFKASSKLSFKVRGSAPFSNFVHLLVSEWWKVPLGVLEQCCHCFQVLVLHLPLHSFAVSPFFPPLAVHNILSDIHAHHHAITHVLPDRTFHDGSCQCWLITVKYLCQIDIIRFASTHLLLVLLLICEEIMVGNI